GGCNCSKGSLTLSPSPPQVNGRELSRLSQEQTLEALRCSKEPLVIQVLRRSPRGRAGGAEAAPTPMDPATLVDSGTQTDITFEHLMGMSRMRPPSPPAVTLEPYGLTDLPCSPSPDPCCPFSLLSQADSLQEKPPSSTGEPATPLTNSQELDSGVGRTDESTRNEESSEHDLLGDEAPSAANTPGSLRKFGATLQPRDFHYSMDSLLAGEQVTASPVGLTDAMPGLTDEEYERYRELLELKCHLENGNEPGLLSATLDVNRNEVALLEEELRHLEFKCRNILRAQKMQQLRERCMKAWLLEEQGLYALEGEPKKHELSDITELPERSDKDSTSAYNTGESCRSTPLLESPLRRLAEPPNLNRPAPPSSPSQPKFRREERARRSPKAEGGSPYLSRRHREEPVAPAPVSPMSLASICKDSLGGKGEARMEWKVKVRSDGTRYVAKRPVRDRLLKARAMKIREERSGMTTDDDAVSEMKMGRYWSKEERKQHLIRAREQRKRREFMMQSRLECLREREGGEARGAAGELNILALSHRKTMKKRSRRILDNWITIQEMLAHGTRSADGRRVYNPLLSVTTV
uniref:PDZ domain containing 4 n=1 Tax=Sphenodon punctatus TaxID=8508 RepID=A0A8D0HE29_SPHPU